MADLKTVTAKEDIDRLEKLIAKMKFEYEQYIRGNLRTVPMSVEREISRIVEVYSRKPPANTTLRFRFNNLAARFISFRQKFQRELGIKEGYIKSPAVREYGEAGNEQNIDLEKAVAMLPANYDKDKVIAALHAKINELKSKGYADIDVALEIENGKPKLRIVTRHEKKTLQD